MRHVNIVVAVLPYVFVQIILETHTDQNLQNYLLNGFEKDESGLGIPEPPVALPPTLLSPPKAAEQSTMLQVKNAAPATRKATSRIKRSGGIITAFNAVTSVRSPPLIYTRTSTSFKNIHQL